MNKTARSAAGAFRHAKRVLQTSPRLVGTLVGSASGAALGKGVSKVNKEHGTKENKELIKDWDKKHPHMSYERISTLANGLSGAVAGHTVGSTYKDLRNLKKAFRAHRRAYSGGASHARQPDMGTPSWLKGVKNKGEAKKAYRAQASQHHPDRGGNEEKMKKVNTEWDSFQKHHLNKLSMMVPGFINELSSIYR